MREFKFFHGINRRKLTAVWTPELVQDLNVHHSIDVSIDVEEELTRIISEEMARNIDEEIITRLTERVNGGDDLHYLNHYINMGGGNRA